MACRIPRRKKVNHGKTQEYRLKHIDKAAGIHYDGWFTIQELTCMKECTSVGKITLASRMNRWNDSKSLWEIMIEPYPRGRTKEQKLSVVDQREAERADKNHHLLLDYVDVIARLNPPVYRRRKRKLKEQLKAYEAEKAAREPITFADILSRVNTNQWSK